MSDQHVPDVCLVGEMGDVTELGRLLQLVLGCAVSCDQKQGTPEITNPESHDQSCDLTMLRSDRWTRRENRS